MQRWLGLVAAVSMLQLNVEAAYAACERADSGIAQIAAVDSGSATHHHNEPATPDANTTWAGEGEAPGDLPVPVECCQAMASCGSSVILNQDTYETIGSTPPAPAIPAGGKILHGRITAPEPPPPKA